MFANVSICKHRRRRGRLRRRERRACANLGFALLCLALLGFPWLLLAFPASKSQGKPKVPRAKAKTHLGFSWLLRRMLDPEEASPPTRPAFAERWRKDGGLIHVSNSRGRQSVAA
jgi:hypothetical protein